MKRAVLYLALAFSVSPALAGSEADRPRDMVLLTVAGLVGKTNRGPVDPKHGDWVWNVFCINIGE
jgi:hypothetical protein